RRHTRFSRDWSSDVCSSDLRRHLQTVSIARILAADARLEVLELPDQIPLLAAGQGRRVHLLHALAVRPMARRADSVKRLTAGGVACSEHAVGDEERSRGRGGEQKDLRDCRSHVRSSSVLVVGYGTLPERYFVPVWPNPPAPRALSAKLSTSSKSACTTGTTTSCAMRSPGSIVNGSRPRFQHEIISSPW